MDHLEAQLCNELGPLGAVEATHAPICDVIPSTPLDCQVVQFLCSPGSPAFDACAGQAAGPVQANLGECGVAPSSWQVVDPQPFVFVPPVGCEQPSRNSLGRLRSAATELGGLFAAVTGCGTCGNCGSGAGCSC